MTEPELPLKPDLTEALRVYNASPPAKAGEPRSPLYWAGLIETLRQAYPPKRAS